MRWLGILAILVAGAAVYLYSQLSNGETANVRKQPAAVVAAADDKPEAAADEAKPAPAPAAVIAPVKREAAPGPKTASGSTGPSPSIESKAAPAAGSAEIVPWTEEERQQWLWTAHGRFEKGNYPGAIEAAMDIAQRNPDSLWEQDAWKVAIQSHCAMSEPGKANKLFAKMTDKTAIEAATKVCSEWNVKLAAP